MLRERARLFSAALFALDLGLVAAAFLIAYSLRADLLPRLGLLPGTLYPLRSYLPLLPLALVLWGGLLLASGRYRAWRVVPLLREVGELSRVSILAGSALVAAIFVLRLDERLLGDQVSRLWLAAFVLLTPAFQVAATLALHLAAQRRGARGDLQQRVLVVGTGDAARAVAEAIEQHRYRGFRVLGLVAPAQDVGAEGEAARRWPVLGSVDELPGLVEREVVDEVILAVPRRDLDGLEEMFHTLQVLGVRTRVVLDLFPISRGRMELSDLDGLPVVTFASGPSQPLQLLGKRLFDVVVSTLLLLVTGPLIAIVATALKLGSRGEVLFRQTRCGLNGRRFTLYKFRTMVADAERRRPDLLPLNEMAGPVFKLRKDPRITRLGRWLRRFSLDELPQLWNVLKGDMSLVGPRPPLPEEVERYKRWQRRRLSMKPGLTCLWQVSGRNEVDFERWMELDLQYIDSWSPLLDLKILARTLPVVLSGRGAS